MPYPPGLTLIPVTGRLAGHPDQAREAVFRAPAWTTGPAANTVLAPPTVHATITDDGTFTVNLPATDDPAWEQAGWTYHVTLRWGHTLITGALAVPRTTVGTLPLAAHLVLHQPASPGTVDYLTAADLGAPGRAASLDPTGRVRAQQLPPGAGGDTTWNDVAGKPDTFPPKAHEHQVADVTGLAGILTAKVDVGLLTTPGDLYVAGAGGVVDRLPAGTEGQTLTVTANSPTGLAWTTPADSGGRRIRTRRGYVTDLGTITPQTTTVWAAVIGGPTFTIPAEPDDEVLFSWAGLIQSMASGGFFDLAILVSGIPVRYASSGGPTPALEGDPALYPDTGFRGVNGLSWAQVVEPGDLDAGTVTIGFAVINPNGGGKIYAHPDYPLRWRLANYGPAVG